MSANEAAPISHEFDDTYEPFAEAISPIDEEFLRFAPYSQRVAAFAPATGHDILLLHKLHRLIVPADVYGIDLDPKAIEVGRQRMKESGILEGGTTVYLVVGDAASTGLPKESGDLVTGLNFIHNVDEPQSIFNEAHRILEPERPFMVSTAYEKNQTEVPAQKEIWEEMYKLGFLHLLRQHIRPGKPKQLNNYTEEQFVNMAKKAGFRRVEVWGKTYNLVEDQVRKILRYSGFARGAMPDIDTKVASDALEHGATMVFNKLIQQGKEPVLPRGWTFMMAWK